MARSAGELSGGRKRTIWVAPPRIFKTGEEWTLKQVRSCEADGYLARNYEHLKLFFRGTANRRFLIERGESFDGRIFPAAPQTGARDCVL